MKQSKRKTNGWDGIVTRTCPVCGTEFVYRSGWAYKLRIKGKIVPYCTYSCFRTVQLAEKGESLVDCRHVIHDSYTREYDNKFKTT